MGYGKENGEKRSYWLSFDRSHLTVKYGKGYHMVETTLLAHDFYKVDILLLNFAPACSVVHIPFIIVHCFIFIWKAWILWRLL